LQPMPRPGHVNAGLLKWGGQKASAQMQKNTALATPAE